MAISRWQPADELSTLQNMMGRLFNDLFEDGNTGRGSIAPMRRLPVDITETKDAYIVKAPVPGFKPEEVEVTFSDGVLTIRARHQEEKEEKKEGTVVRREVMYGDFMRQIVVPADVRGENIQASFENGQLVVELPREARPQPKKIEVRAKDSKESKDGREHKDTKAGTEANRQPEMVGGSNKRS